MTVYLIRDPEARQGLGAVKIGYTSSRTSEKRLSAMQVGAVSTLELASELCGAPKAVEQELHVRFAGLLIRGEWYEDRPEIHAEFERRQGLHASEHEGVTDEQVAGAFHRLAQDDSLTARRDAALIALLAGAGLRRAEAVALDLDDLDSARETLDVRGREVPLSGGCRRALKSWLSHRGEAPGPLLTPITRSKPRRAVIERRLSTHTVVQAVTKRLGESIGPDDLRSKFITDLLDVTGGDASTVARIVGMKVESVLEYTRLEP